MVIEATFSLTWPQESCNLFVTLSSNLFESNDKLQLILNFHVLSLVYYFVNQLNKRIKKKNNLSGHCILQSLYSEIRVLFIVDWIAIRFHVCSLFQLCLS